MKDRSLVFFTLVSQISVGVFTSSTCVRLAFTVSGISAGNISQLLSLEIISFALIATSLLSSITHLGVPQRAVRAILNIRQSWLSREIFFGLSFAAFSGINILFQRLSLAFAPGLIVFQICAILSGGAFIYAMARLYMLRTVPAWQTLHTLLTFVLTAASLGTLLSAFFLTTSIDLLDSPLQALVNTLARCAILFTALQIINQGMITNRKTLRNTIQPGKRKISLRSPGQPSWSITLSLLVSVITSASVLMPSITWHSALLALAFSLGLLAEYTNRLAFFQAYERTGL